MSATKYNKDYSAKTAMEWFSERKWTGFLMRIPLNKTKGYPCTNANDVMSIRAIASMLSTDPLCERKFSVTADFDTKVITLTATLKEDGTRSDGNC